MLRRTLARLDVTSRTLYRADRAGLLLRRHARRAGASPPTAPTCSRCRTTPARAPRIALSPTNFGTYPMANGQARIAARFYGETGRSPPREGAVGRPLDADEALELGLVTAAPDDLDWDDEVRIAVEERASLSPDALTGMEANLRFGRRRDDGDADLRPPLGLAELDLHPAERDRRRRRARRSSARAARRNSTGTASDRVASRMSGRPDDAPNSPHRRHAPGAPNEHRLQREDPQQRRPRRATGRCSARSSTGSPSSCTGGRTWGPRARSDVDVYLRTAISVDPKGWAHFDYVKMPDYRWGIFLAPAEAGPPGQLRRAQGRAGVAGRPRRVPREPAPAHRHAGRHRARVGRAAAAPRAHRPSLYDLRNLFQVNVEEGRHLWAMVYLLHAYFGRDGREEAEALLERRSGDADNPRILGAFNEKTPDWLSFFMFTFFTDRDGKYQLVLARRVRLRSARAHLPLHADRGSAPHVRRRVGRRPRSSSAPAR